MSNDKVFEAETRNLFHGWLLFAIGSLGIAGTLAFLVAMAKTPAVTPFLSPDAFNVTIVGHVTFALMIWCLAFVGTLWVYTGARARGGRAWSIKLGWLALGLALVGAAIVFVSVLLGRGRAFLTDYVPILDTPLFYIGYAIFSAGILLEMVDFIVGLIKRPAASGLPLGAWGMAAASAAMVIAVLTFGQSFAAVALSSQDWLGSPPYYQIIVWGLGHVIQYVYVIAMGVAWYALAALGLGANPFSPRFAKTIFALTALYSLGSLIGALWLGTLQLPRSLLASMTILMGLSFAAFFHFVHIVYAAWKQGALGTSRALPWKNPQFAALTASVTLFAVGTFLDPATGMGTLKVPAHYHGVVVGGVTIAFMGLAYHFVRLVERELLWKRVAWLQPYIYGVGIAIMIAGLAWAGSEGATRKTYIPGIQGDPGYFVALNLMGLGAVLAVVGGVMFVVNLILSLIRTQGKPAVVTQRAAAGGQ